MRFKADEIVSVLTPEIEHYRAKIEAREVGRVLEIGDGIARVYGLSGIMSGEMVEFTRTEGNNAVSALICTPTGACFECVLGAMGNAGCAFSRVGGGPSFSKANPTLVAGEHVLENGHRYAAGAFQVEGTTLYVTRGLGTVRFSLRFLCRPELAILTLRRPA